MKKHTITFIKILFGLLVNAKSKATVNSKLLEELWSAKWVAHPNIEGDETGEYLFKKVLSFKTVAKELCY